MTRSYGDRAPGSHREPPGSGGNLAFFLLVIVLVVAACIFLGVDTVWNVFTGTLRGIYDMIRNQS